MKATSFLAAAAILAAAPAGADTGQIIVDQARAKITTAKADANIARYGAAEIGSAEALLKPLNENVEDDDKTDVESINRQIDALVKTAEVKAQLAAAKESAATRAEAGVRAEVASAKAVASDAQQTAAAATAEAAALREQMKAMQMRQTDAGATLVLQDVVFATGTATLRPGALQRLQPLVGYLNSNADVRVRIDGHTDSQGSNAYNQQLSERRAEAVKAALVQAGVDAGRIDAVGHGETQSVASNATAAGRQQNRRVELTLLGQQVDTFG